MKIRSFVIPTASAWLTSTATAAFARITLRNLVLTAAAAVFCPRKRFGIGLVRSEALHTPRMAPITARTTVRAAAEAARTRAVVVGPYGGLATNSGTVTRTGTGQFSNSGTAKPDGMATLSSTRETPVARAATCSHNGTLTGPDGRTRQHGRQRDADRAGSVLVDRDDSPVPTATRSTIRPRPIAQALPAPVQGP